MKGPLDVHQFLLSHAVSHDIVRLPRSTADARQLPDVLGLPASSCISVFLLRAQFADGEDQIVAAIATADVAADDGGLRAGVCEELGGSSVVRAITTVPSDVVSARTDYLASHLGPLLLPSDMAVLATPKVALLGAEVVYAATGDSGTALAVRAVDLLDLTGAKVLRTVAPAAHDAEFTLDLTRQSVLLRAPVPERANGSAGAARGRARAAERAVERVADVG